MTPKDIENEIQGLIADEMLIANDEGQPTSRLTSLSIKVDKLFREQINANEKYKDTPQRNVDIR